MAAERCQVDGAELDGTLALLVTYRQIGGFLTRYYWLVAALAALAAVFFRGAQRACGASWRCTGWFCVLVLALGMAYSLALPPYGAPDEKVPHQPVLHAGLPLGQRPVQR